ncbi:MAG: riboflavin synthase [Desulfobacterales bacterium]|jgi:riboflavin synthase|nr:riboflavin synthase [Desulfobacterales bacterium]
MFTGIIEGMGSVAGIRPSGQGKRFAVNAGFSLADSRIGDSIAVNGACLTAIVIDGSRFEADVSPETLSKTVFGGIRIGDRVNLERALRLSDRIDGHLVSGHVDGVGALQSRRTLGNAVLIRVSVPPALGRYMIQKGSVAVDGISLTINACGDDFFEISIIPHTAMLTTIGFKKPGDPVNIETDMIGKYVERFMRGKPAGGIDRQFLATSGFL